MRLSFRRFLLIVAVVVLGVALFLVRVFVGGDEDAWLCRDGAWVAHGRPFGPQPTTACASPSAARSIALFYYDATRDLDAQGNIRCSPAGLVAVRREVPQTTTPIQDAVRLLIRGELTDAVRAGGLTTEFPLPGLMLSGASVRDTVLTLAFDDPQHHTSGGSCRVGILRAQIEATATQFGGISAVRYQPEDGLLQP